MAKRFNVTGTCFPHRHYMADISAKSKIAMGMINYGDYFAINRPRQYGKTTLLETLKRELLKSDEWLVFNTSFEGIDSVVSAEMTSFCKAFVHLLAEEMVNRGEKELENYLNSQVEGVKNLLRSIPKKSKNN